MVHPRELALLQEVLQISTRELSHQDQGLLMTIRLQVGEAALVLPDQLLSCWKTLVENTAFSHVRLELEPLPLVFRCLFCREEFPCQGNGGSCPLCSSIWIEVVSGNQVLIKEIDVLPGYGLA